MSQKVDLKLRAVRIAEYRYRHEAEFAAGFLDDAGIPYRLQIDDAGGADLGLSMLHPSAIWVRSTDERIARELLALEEVEPDRIEGEGAGNATPPSAAVVHGRRTEAGASRLPPLERGLSAVLSVALFSALPYLPFGPYRAYTGGLILATSIGFLVIAALGRAPRAVEGLLRMLSGSAPE